MIFGYTRFLERENDRLHARIEALELRNQELVIKMFSRPGSSPISDDKPAPKHLMTKGDNRASCSCGWVHVSEDPGVLQNAISSHFKDSTTAQRGRRSWPQAKAALERASEEKQ
jgi:hypothetical protein